MEEVRTIALDWGLATEWVIQKCGLQCAEKKKFSAVKPDELAEGKLEPIP